MAEVLFEKRNHTGLLTMNKPETLNALSSGFIEEINRALDLAESDRDVYVLLITGSGKSFSVGADIEEMYDKNSQEIFQWSNFGSNLNLRIEKMPVPVIALINGYALGGGLELAMACDIRLAADTAKLGLPETSLGVICGAGGTQRLPRIVGYSAAKEMIFTGKKIDTQEALSIGLVNHVYPASELEEDGFKLASQIEKNGRLAVRTAKKAIAFSKESDIEKGCLFEREIFSKLFETEDQKICMGGFLERKKK
ncbi:MAG: hypothetical protein GX663_00790 [Clostridiales bacterium]|nr:hypothetical protein [Clostridiales bacterium]